MTRASSLPLLLHAKPERFDPESRGSNEIKATVQSSPLNRFSRPILIQSSPSARAFYKNDNEKPARHFRLPLADVCVFATYNQLKINFGTSIEWHFRAEKRISLLGCG